jgi:16S rRNA (cytosine1402-N4)-methyltransferase
VALERALPATLDTLAPGGRMVVMSYHSLEDRIAKAAIVPRTRSRGPIDLPVELPGDAPKFRLLTRGAERPSDAEVAANPRSASVRVRAVERLDPTTVATTGRARTRTEHHPKQTSDPKNSRDSKHTREQS